jgi:hypothetical protein
MRSVNVKFHEFIMHRIADMNISLLYFFEFFTLEEQELERTTYMKDVILYEAVPTKSISSFLELYFIFYEFSNFRNGQVQKKLLQAFLFTVRCMPSVNSPAIAGRTCYGRGKGREKGPHRRGSRLRKTDRKLLRLLASALDGKGAQGLG